MLAAVTKAREAKNVNNETGLSGGQEQRLALYVSPFVLSKGRLADADVVL